MSFTMIARNVALAAALGAALALAAGPAMAEEAAPATNSSAPQVATAKKGTVNINTATSAELARLPRVGAKLADRIVAHRNQQGPFKRVEDLMEVKGVGERMFASLKPYLATSGTTTLAAKVSSAGTRGASSRAGKGATRKGVAPAAR